MNFFISSLFRPHRYFYTAHSPEKLLGILRSLIVSGEGEDNSSKPYIGTIEGTQFRLIKRSGSFFMGKSGYRISGRIFSEANGSLVIANIRGLRAFLPVLI